MKSLKLEDILTNLKAEGGEEKVAEEKASSENEVKSAKTELEEAI